MINKMILYILVLITFILTFYSLSICLLFQSLSVAIISLLISWIISNIIYNWTLSKKVSPENRAVLITDCDTGVGNQLAIEVDKFGFHAFAGVLFQEGVGAKNLITICSDRLNVLIMNEKIKNFKI
jgi:hypothetical protein